MIFLEEKSPWEVFPLIIFKSPRLPLRILSLECSTTILRTYMHWNLSLSLSLFLAFSWSNECMIHDIPRPINEKKPPISSVKNTFVIHRNKTRERIFTQVREREREEILLRYFNLSSTRLHKIIIIKRARERREDLTVHQSSHIQKSFKRYYVNMKIFFKFYQIFIIVTTWIRSFRFEKYWSIYYSSDSIECFFLSSLSPSQFASFKIDLLEFLINILLSSTTINKFF